jgi:tetratricopeptide (TPR) repeat protein
MEIKRKDIFAIALFLCFLCIAGMSSASEKLTFNFSGKTHIIFSEPTSEDFKNNSVITSNLYADNTQLVPNNYWITKRVDNDRYDLCYKDWSNFFLRIDKTNYLVYKVSGQIGGTNNVVGEAIPGIQVQLNSKYHTVSLYFDSAYLELNTKTAKAELRIGDLLYFDSNAWEVTETDDQVFHIRQKSFWPRLRLFWKVDLKRNKFYSVSDEKFDAPVANEMNARLREIQFASASGDSAISSSIKPAATRNELDLVEAVKKFPDYWQSYLDLGRYYIVRGEFKKAADVYARYPPFKDEQKGNRIVVSNEAATAGFDLYYIGAVKEARPFFEIAANSGTGSAASMNCEAFLLMAEGTYTEASAKFYRLAKAYDHRVGYTNSLSLLNLLNRQKTAWDVFNTLNLAEFTPTIWNSAFVAHRREGKKAEELIPWLLDGNRASLSINEVSTYLLMQSIVDRITNKSTLKNLAELEKIKPEQLTFAKVSNN